VIKPYCSDEKIMHYHPMVAGRATLATTLS